MTAQAASLKATSSNSKATISIKDSLATKSKTFSGVREEKIKDEKACQEERNKLHAEKLETEKAEAVKTKVGVYEKKHAAGIL